MAMTSASMKRDLLKAGRFAGLAAYLVKITGVNNGGTVALDGEWAGLPSMKAYTYQRRSDSYDLGEQTGDTETIKKRLGLDVKTTFNQRDADTYELDQSYDGAECLLLLAGHRFTRMATPKYQWIASFGTVVPHDAEISSETGEVPFYFKGKINAQQIVIGAAVGAVAFPDLATLTAPELIPSADITIVSGGCYKFVDL